MKKESKNLKSITERNSNDKSHRYTPKVYKFKQNCITCQHYKLGHICIPYCEIYKISPKFAFFDNVICKNYKETKFFIEKKLNTPTNH